MSSSAGTSCTDAEEDAEDVENEVVGTRPASFARYSWSSPSSSSPTPSSFTTRRRRGRASATQSSSSSSSSFLSSVSSSPSFTFPFTFPFTSSFSSSSSSSSPSSPSSPSTSTASINDSSANHLEGLRLDGSVLIIGTYPSKGQPAEDSISEFSLRALPRIIL
ncbi:putative protein TPRXL [Vespa mandarinia]|uniref:putative protein TPRXL n=1 Tax=Vespa mandarinia TaxID=7446 RepID=UPI00160BCA79|nr:putative protein TPRXL [Vespa mandarinia]XP_035731005.1 putative protein TPRXL [Vespa mandarinia]